MRIVETELGTEIYADDGMAIRPKLSKDPVVESVLLGSGDTPENWEDCEKPRQEPGPDDVNDADMVAALIKLGVNMED